MAGRNYTYLSTVNPLDGVDERIEFNEENHEYRVNSALVERSVTAVVAKAMNDTPFDANLVIRKNLASWRAKENRYGKMVAGLDDDAAAAKIKAAWADTARLGTDLHRRLEAMLNDEPEPNDCETDFESKLLELELEKLKLTGYKPFRTELSLWWQNNGAVVCAGQLDALLEDENGDLVLVDLKRTDKNLTAKSIPFGYKTGIGVMSKYYASEFIKYSLQTSLYAVMLEQRTGRAIDPSKRFLLQAHPSLPSVEWIECRCLDDEARALLGALEA